jgi:hypothetical protein
MDLSASLQKEQEDGAPISVQGPVGKPRAQHGHRQLPTWLLNAHD